MGRVRGSEGGKEGGKEGGRDAEEGGRHQVGLENSVH